MKRLRSAVVTGGSRGIGLCITKAFVQAGYFTVVGARKDSGLKDSFGDSVEFLSIDVRQEENHVELAELAAERTGGLNVYVNNAGFSEWRPIEEINAQFLRDLLDTNLAGAFWGCKAAARFMKNAGCVINISSIAGKRGSANNAAYCASKFGMNGLTQALAKELGRRAIRVNALCPVLIETEGLIQALESPFAPAAGNPKKFIEDFAKTNSALGRLPSGEDVAAMCVYLASDAARSVTGQCINIDCGVFPQ